MEPRELRPAISGELYLCLRSGPVPLAELGTITRFLPVLPFYLCSPLGWAILAETQRAQERKR